MPRDALRLSHLGIRLNDQSAKMEKRLAFALDLTMTAIGRETGLTPVHEPIRYLSEIIDGLNQRYAGDERLSFERAFQGAKSFIKPDGGFWCIEEWGEPRRYFLVAEAKRQGTNTARMAEGLPKQSKGNAIERLGKNMRGIDAMFLGETITPFVCFGEGDDFADDSSIRERVATLNGFFPLNRIFIDKIQLGEDTLKPVSLFFREDPWRPAEMVDILLPVCQRAIEYYREKYQLP